MMQRNSSLLRNDAMLAKVHQNVVAVVVTTEKRSSLIVCVFPFEGIHVSFANERYSVYSVQCLPYTGTEQDGNNRANTELGPDHARKPVEPSSEPNGVNQSGDNS